MIVTYHGELHLKLQTGDTVIAINPVAKDSGKRVVKYGADIALCSTNLPFTSGVEQVTFSDREPFVISGPGEYEKNGVSIKGVRSNFVFEGIEKINTAFVFTFDGIRICALGVMQEKLSPEVRDAIGAVDILFVPVLEGEKFNYLSPSLAESVAVSLEAKVIIPVGYNDKTLPIFLKEAGATGVAKQDKLTIKKKEVESKDGEVVVLDIV